MAVMRMLIFGIQRCLGTLRLRLHHTNYGNGGFLLGMFFFRLRKILFPVSFVIFLIAIKCNEREIALFFFGGGLWRYKCVPGLSECKKDLIKVW